MIGHIDKVSNKIVSGWASEAKNAPSTEVFLYIDGKHVSTQETTYPRPGLIERGINSHGTCGFRFELADNMLNVSKEVEVSVRIKQNGTLVDIGNSPYIFKGSKWVDTLKQNYPRGKGEKVLIIGMPKSGTTALTYTLESQYSNPKILFEPNGTKNLLDIEFHASETANDGDLICKCLYFNPSLSYINEISQFYTKCIWIYRDPRDWLVSTFLYRWYKGHNVNKQKFEAAYQLVLQKEKDPKSVPFHEIIQTFAKEKTFYQKLAHVIKEIETIKQENKKWYFLSFESFIDNTLDALASYLDVPNLTRVNELPKNFSRVERKKEYGDWKNWFTYADKDFIESELGDYLAYFNYDASMDLPKEPQLNPKFGSQYMYNLFTKGKGTK